MQAFHLRSVSDIKEGQRCANNLPQISAYDKGNAPMPKELPPIEMLRKLLRYDPNSGKLYWLVRARDMFANDRACSVWNARYAGNEAFTCLNAYGYYHGRIFRSAYYAHRIAWALATGWSPVAEIDHINGDRSDNRLINLREVSHALNARNAFMRLHNTSGHNGVVWHKAGQKWLARIRIDGVEHHLGSFSCIEDAIAARKSAQIGHGFTERHGK
jgi:hypothetical protein